MSDEALGSSRVNSRFRNQRPVLSVPAQNYPESLSTAVSLHFTGDSRHRFDPTDGQELAKAEQRFRDLTGAGFTAAVRTGAGQVSRIRSFDPNAEETVFFPRLVGG